MNPKADDLTREIEFRLKAEPKTLDRLAEFLFPDKAANGLRSQKLRAIYYDTADRRLRQRGLALRVRKNGKKFTQTLKTDSKGSVLFDRREWEVEVEDFKPDFRAFDDAEVADLVGLIFPEELEPQFETDVQRRLGLFELTDAERTPSRIEVAFDVGTIKSKQRSTEVSEVELELKSGEPSALFELARMIRNQASVRLLTLDKPTRGYQLAAGEAPRWAKAEKLKLSPEMTVEQGLEAVFQAGLEQWLRNEQAAFDGTDPEGVHQLRVALRRLRSALSLFGDVLVKETRSDWNTRLKEILNAMGPVRDLDVFEEEMLDPILKARPEDEGLIALRGVTAAERAKAQEQVREAIGSQKYADTVLDLLAWIERKGWREAADVDLLIAQRMPLPQLAGATLAKGLKRVRKRGRNFESIDADARHQVRIALKKLRYGTEYFASLFESKDTGSFIAAASTMQDHLGHLNDVAVAERLVDDLIGAARAGAERVKAARGGGVVIGWYAHLVSIGEADTVEDWRRFAKRDPFWPSGKQSHAKAGKDRS